MASAAVLMAIILTGGAAHGARVTHPEDFVNLLGGTFTDGQKFSTGNTLPLVGRPWGFNHWSPQSNPGRSSWWFSGEDHTFRWIRCTHQPSPWIGDYAWFMWGPQMGNIALDPVGFWEPRAAVMRPYMFDATTGPDGMRIELTPSMHGAIMRVTFPAYNPHGLDKRVCLRLDDSDWHVATKGADGRGVIKGTSMRVNGRPANFRFHIHAESDEEVVKVEKNGNHLACFTYAKDATVVTVRAATSFIDGQQALTSYQREVGKDSSGHDFDSLKAEAREEWRSMLGRVEVVDPGDDVDGDWVQTHLTIFYTGLYRALSFPRRLDEVASDGSVVHYSAYAPRGGTGRGPLCTDNGFWDTFRTVYPMLSLLYPDKLGGIIQGWLNAYKAGGWLPQWSSPGYRQSMVGTFSDVIVADAIVKKVPGFEVDVAWSAIRRDSFEGEPPGDKGVGKVGLSIYDQHKYIPSDVGVSEMVSRSLDFAFADVAVANAATLLAKQALTPAAKQRFEADASKLRGRGMAVMRNLFDRKSGLMRPKNKNGEFDGNFFANRWGGPYTEGSAWHHSFPPFDVEALAKLHGGAKHLLAKLHELVNTAGTFQVGGYGQEIHEMTEMRAGAFGQYGHNNQPCHHQLYLFALLGEAATTQKLVRRVMDHSYGVDFYAGDEDNGEQGAWFVLSALGLYSVAPGASNEYVLGSPIFRHVAVHLPALEEATALKSPAKPARTLHVVARGTAQDSQTVRSVSWNSQVLTGDGFVPVIGDDIVQKGGTLRFVFDAEPSPELPYDAEAAARGEVASSSSSSSSSSGVLGIFSRGDSGAPATAAAARAASGPDTATLESMEQLKREAAAARANLKEQVDTYASAAEHSSENLRLAQLELEKERHSRLQEVTALQTALKDQAREISEYETTISTLTTKAAAGERAIAEGASGALSDVAKTAAVAQGVSALRASLEVERKEHERTKVIQKMLEDQIRRATELQVLSASIEKDMRRDSGGGGGTEIADTPYLLSSDWLQRILVISGILTALGACVHMSNNQDGATGGGGGGASLAWTPRKAPSHIV